MDGRSILLAKIDSLLDNEDSKKFFISPGLSKFIHLSSQDKVELYCIIKQSSYEHKVASSVWKENVSGLKSVIFSEDGKYFAVLTCQNLIEKLIIFTLNVNQNVVKLHEYKLPLIPEQQFGASNKYLLDPPSPVKTDECYSLVHYSNDSVVVKSPGYLRSFQLTNSDECVESYCVSFHTQLLSFCANRKSFFYIDTNSKIYIYCISSGDLFGIFDVHKYLPSTLNFTRLAVDSYGSLTALLTDDNQVFLLDTTSRTLLPPPQHNSAPPSSSSVSSFKSATSKATNYSRVESLRREAERKKIVSLANASSAQSTWLSYLEKLTLKRVVKEGIAEESLPIISIKDIPASYLIHSIHFCQEHVGIWATHKDKSSDGFYRLYDKSSGVLESVDILAHDTQVIPANTSDLSLDLFLQDSNLCLPLGIISREKLVTKMVGGESEGSMEQMIGHAVLPLPLLQDGLANTQIDMVRLSLNLLTQGFQTKLAEGAEAVEELVQSTEQVFNTIAQTLETCESSSKWSVQVCILALTHANTLLSLLSHPPSQTQLQILILQQVISLRGDENVAIDIPMIPQWVPWLLLSDEEVILNSTSSLPLVHCFLLLHRGWSRQDLQGDRFYNTVHRIILGLLKLEKLESAIELLTSVNLDSENEVKTICMKTKNRPLRNYLVNCLSSKLKAEWMDAWKFLITIESAVIKYGQYFLQFEEAPLSLTESIVLSESDQWSILADLYFCTGDETLKDKLEKNSCWEYLINNNYSEGILTWLGDESYKKFAWPCNKFSEWKLDESLVERVSTSNSTNLTKLLVCNRMALKGAFMNEEKHDLEKLILRVSLAGILPEIKTRLKSEFSSLTYGQFLELISEYAIKNNLVNVVVQSDLKSINYVPNISPKWLRLLQLHAIAADTRSTSEILEAIQDTTQYLASLQSTQPSQYLNQHPLLSIVTSLLNNQDVTQLYSHVSPLLASAVAAPPPQDDITLYTVLAHTLPFHTDNIFHHQIQPHKEGQLPNFKNEGLSSRFGIIHSLGLREFLKQGRPASALNYIIQNGKFKTRTRLSANFAHGLALNHLNEPEVTRACVVFVELLGLDSSLLQTHITAASALSHHMDQKQLRELLLHLVQGREDASITLTHELESYLRSKWSESCSLDSTMLQDFHLAVRLSASHCLPPPTSLLHHCLTADLWSLFIVAAQIFQLPSITVQETCKMNSNHAISKHIFYALQATGKPRDEEKECSTFEPETNLFALLSKHGKDAEMMLSLSLKLNSPTLAILASSVQTLPVEIGLMTWLVASMTVEDAANTPEPPWTPETVTGILVHAVRQRYFRTLAQGFSIYQPTNPLTALADFFIQCVIQRKFKESVMPLKIFMAALFNLPYNAKTEEGYLMSRRWIAITAFRMVCTALAFCFPSAYLRQRFLESLCEAQFYDIHQDGKNLLLYLKLSQCLEETSLELDWELLLLHQDSTPLLKTLSSLAQLHMFDIAYKFAGIAQLPSDSVLVTQWTELALAEKNEDPDFWQKCETVFRQANIDPQSAVEFYQNQVKLLENLNDRYMLQKFSLSWLKKTQAPKDEIIALQIELYMTCLHEKFKPEVMTEGVAVSPLRCLSHSLPTCPIPSPPKLTVTQTHRLDSIIHQFLIVGDINTAFLLQTLFHYSNQDCELLLACMQLAEGVLTLTRLPARIQEYLSENTVKPTRVLFSSPLPKKNSHSVVEENYSQSVVSALYSLQAHQTCPTPLFSNIISAFNISLTFHTRYQDEILNAEPLERLLPTHDFDIATNLLNLACLTRTETTQYICSQIMSVLNSESVDGKYILWSCDLEKKFSFILDLTGSALLLGNLLLAADPSLTSMLDPQSYKQVVELLVLAHHCYTKVCYMEGISIVLNLARSLVNRLLNRCQWPLMVRLLTGIGRYTEMIYVFQILKDNDQFEFLLGKGLDKQPDLMSASLEFVRGDKELFSLVAHHFSMYGELAELYEGEARSELARLEISPTGTLLVNPHNTGCLQTAISKYSDAAEHYMQAKKMKCGVSSVQQAELIAVQLSLMVGTSNPAVLCLINLPNNQALHAINTALTCEQAHIVASAYNVSVDWSAALYHHCVVRGDSLYLQTWMLHHQLTQNIVQDVVRRFQCERETSAGLEVNMKRFVSSVNQLDIKYRVASQLGFKDVLHTLLNSPDMAYLKDTVWQSGFKKQVL